MNKRRKKIISSFSSKIEEVISMLEDVLEEEREAYENTPESLLESFRAEESEQSIELMEAAVDDLTAALDNLSEI